MPLPTLTDTWDLDGISFNSSADGNGFAYVVSSSSGWDGSAPARPDLQARPGDRGAYRAPNYEGSRVVRLSGLAQAQSRAGRDDLKIALESIMRDPMTVYPLTKTTATRSLTMYVEKSDRVAITDLPDGVTVTFDIQVVAADPRKYSSAVKQANTVLAQAAADGVWWSGPAGTTGTEWNGPASPFTGTVWQASSGTAGTISLDNAGTTAAPILFTVDGPSSGSLSNFSIVQVSTGETITYPGTVGVGSQMVINTGTGLVRLDGADVGGLLTSAQFFEIPAQSSITVQFYATGGSPTAQLTATWADTY